MDDIDITHDIILRKWGIISGAVLLSALLLILKIFGVWDYTSRFGIEWIEDGEFYNSMMMIDDDIETTWGREEYFVPGSYIEMKFKYNRVINEISILNVSELNSVIMGIYISDEGEAYERCLYAVEKSGNQTIYKLDRPYNGEYLVLTYENEESGHWPITEIEISE